MNIYREIAQFLSQSAIFKQAKNLWEQNQKNYWLRLSKLQKLYLGTYIILRDYAQDSFPPSFTDQALAYEAESNFFSALPGVDKQIALDTEIHKPFWFGNERYLEYFIEICKFFKTLGIAPPQTIVELGAGSGWMSEFLALMKFQAIATTIGATSIDQNYQRIKSVECKNSGLSFKVFKSPMESIDICLSEQGELPVDVIFVFEALHHAYDWRTTFKAVYNSLKPGGWFLICREPNLLHTFVSYRLALLSNTHEIGMSRSEMLKSLTDIGFTKSIILKNYFHFFIRPHWIASQK